MYSLVSTTMGRRAKNKQAAPIPFQEVEKDYSRPSAKKLGKRKADSDEATQPRKKTKGLHSDKTTPNPVLQLDLGSDEDVSEPLPFKLRKSKQSSKPTKIIPDSSTSDSSSDSDEDGPTTMANMEARSRALDAQAGLEADLDAEEMQFAAQGEEEDDIDIEEGTDQDDEAFQLPNAEERAEEKKVGGPDVHVVQRRMRECVRILGNFKKLAAKER